MMTMFRKGLLLAAGLMAFAVAGPLQAAPAARVTYVSAGTAGPYSVTFPYLSRNDVSALIDGEDCACTLTWNTSTTVTLSVTPAASSKVTLLRSTTLGSSLVTFSGGTLSSKDLNRVVTQLLYLEQERNDLTALAVQTQPYETTAQVLPSPADRASKFAAFNSDGDLVASVGSGAGLPTGEFGADLIDTDTASEARADLELGNLSLTGPANLNLSSVNNGLLITPFFEDIGFGSNWYTNHLIQRYYAIGHTDSRFGLSSISRSVGSTLPSNPAASDYAMLAMSYKDDWMDSLVVGEVDAGYGLVRQGIKSDAGGWLVDVRKVFEIDGDATVWDGGITPIEAGSHATKTFYDLDGNPYSSNLLHVQSISAFTDAAKRTYGTFSEQRVGVGFAVLAGGLLTDLDNGDHPDHVGGVPSWLWFLHNQSARPTGGDANEFQNFGVSGDGQRILIGTAGNRKYLDVSGNSLAVRNSADSANLLSLTNGGALTVADSATLTGGLLRLGTSFTVTQLNTLTGIGNGWLAYCSNGNAGNPRAQVITAAGEGSGGVWINLVTGTAISAS